MTDIRLDGNDQLSGAEAFAAWAACSLDDCRDPVTGYDFAALASLAREADTFAREVHALIEIAARSVLETMADDKSNDWTKELVILRAAIAGEVPA